MNKNNLTQNIYLVSVFKQNTNLEAGIIYSKKVVRVAQSCKYANSI